MPKKFSLQVRHYFDDPLAIFKLFERFLALFCVFIPIILYLTDDRDRDGHLPGPRGSISDYVYMCHNYVFGMLLGIAAMLFIVNGFIYFKKEDNSKDSTGKWYNIGIGLSLLGVVCFPWREHTIVHFSFAGIFFVGNALATGFFHTKRWPKSNITMSVLTVVVLALHFAKFAPWLTLFWAEWVSLAVVGVHFWLESW
ncbi:hypothetical protein KXD93_25610 [Mucilaginibacter sp. BJC16-A38]|uniref:DUF7103 family protein n=1 Tax=Mucilaginibacter phenanthrenivorans TaxID=1234842 RepID=UPI002157E33A|nr:hypothetical protein [Mucilaginibacter phenanthrenivorans]MCR8561060.1 hypothetical protein [Mucilaginibacter phenanthrenivorans]